MRTKQEHDDIVSTASRLNIPSLQPLYLDVIDHDSCIAAMLLIQVYIQIYAGYMSPNGDSFDYCLIVLILYMKSTSRNA